MQFWNLNKHFSNNFALIDLQTDSKRCLRKSLDAFYIHSVNKKLIDLNRRNDVVWESSQLIFNLLCYCAINKEIRKIKQISIYNLSINEFDSLVFFLFVWELIALFCIINTFNWKFWNGIWHIFLILFLLQTTMHCNNCEFIMTFDALISHLTCFCQQAVARNRRSMWCH